MQSSDEFCEYWRFVLWKFSHRLEKFKSPVWKRSLLRYGEFVSYCAIGQEIFTIIKHVSPDFSTVCPTIHIWTHLEGIVVSEKPNNFMISVGWGNTMTFSLIELMLTLASPRCCNSGDRCFLQCGLWVMSLRWLDMFRNGISYCNIISKWNTELNCSSMYIWRHTTDWAQFNSNSGFLCVFLRTDNSSPFS